MGMVLGIVCNVCGGIERLHLQNLPRIWCCAGENGYEDTGNAILVQNHTGVTKIN